MPFATDIPQDFRVSFRKNSSAPPEVLGAKGKLMQAIANEDKEKDAISFYSPDSKISKSSSSIYS